jgi:hypothetical protein
MMIRHWTWENGQWNEQSNLELGEASALQVTSLGVNSSADGRLMAEFSKDDLADRLAMEDLQYSGRQSVQVVPAPETSVAGEIVAEATLGAASESQPMATASSVPAGQSVETTAPDQPMLTPASTPTTQSESISVDNRLSGPVVGGVLALLVVGLAAGLVLLVVRRSARKR